MIRKPRVSSPCVAERYNQSRDSRIIEFFDPELQIGGLIELRRRDGKLQVIPYSLSEGIEVVVEPERAIAAIGGARWRR